MLSPERVALIQEAKRLHGRIFPVGTRKTWEKCFTVVPSGKKPRRLFLWFDTADRSSHITQMEV